MSGTGRTLRLRWALAVGLLMAVSLMGCGGGGGNDVGLPGTAALRAALTSAVKVAALGLGGVAVNSPPDQDIIRRFVDAVRFLDDRSGYFFVYDYTNNVCIAHAINKAWEGQDKTAYQDSQGMFVI